MCMSLKPDQFLIERKKAMEERKERCLSKMGQEVVTLTEIAAKLKTTS